MSFDDNKNTVTLVAIAKNESAYLLEWIAYHLSIGISRIVVYDNESSDDTGSLLERLASHSDKVTMRAWPSVGLHDSPQTGAYNDALKSIETDWVMFLDIDEYIVPFRDRSLPAFLAALPADASSVHINWRGFGSSGLQETGYGFVTTAFTQCSHPHWGNNHHFKSIARTKHVEEVFIHDIETKEGRRILSDLQEFETISRGLSNRIVHNGIQINHYQCKTFTEFKERMNRGDANYHPLHELKKRDDSEVRFLQLDENEFVDTSISVFKDLHRAEYAKLKNALDLEI